MKKLIALAVFLLQVTALSTSAAPFLVPKDGKEIIKGDQAQKILETLPPEVSNFYDGELALAVQKHFRYLVIPNQEGLFHLEISCSSAKWSGAFSRVPQPSKLVADTPTCVFNQNSKVESDGEFSVQEISQQAAAANAIEVTLPVSEKPFDDGRVCKFRFCP